MDITKRIETTKYLIEKDNLIVPGFQEDKIIKLVLPYILQNKDYIVGSLKNSTSDIELSKVPDNLKKYFKNQEINKRYQELIINRYMIHQCLLPQEYSTSFKGNQIPWDLNIPYELDELSHIFIGHEVMHVLALSYNYEEWKYALLYNEVIPMLYELIQADDENFETKKNIINLRLSMLVKMYNNAYNDEILEKLQNDKEGLKYYQIPEHQYFISFYYTALVYKMYNDSPEDILTIIKNVLNQKITTKEMLERLNIYDDINETSFEKSFSLILE